MLIVLPGTPQTVTDGQHIMITCQWLALDMAWQYHARGFPTHKQLLIYTRTVIDDLKNTEIGNFTGHYSGFAATTVLFQVLQFPIHIIRRFLEDSGKHLSFFFWQLIVLLSIYGVWLQKGYSLGSIRYIFVQLCLEKHYI